jgi:rhodanese-related sulfurtransferase
MLDQIFVKGARENNLKNIDVSIPRDKLTVIDVRTEQEYAQGHVPGALLLPIQTLREHMGQVPADGSVLLLCRTGRRAETAYDMIREAYPQKKNLWFLKGIPVYGNDGSFTFK